MYPPLLLADLLNPYDPVYFIFAIGLALILASVGGLMLFFIRRSRKK